MSRRLLGVIRDAIIRGDYDLTRHAVDEMAEDNLSLLDLECAILDGEIVTFHARAGEGDRLYGSITSANIAEALEENVNQEVDRRKIDLEEPLKELGTHAVTVRLAPEAEAKVTVVIEREE